MIKKILPVSLAFLILIFLINACGNDNSSNSTNALQGEWIISNIVPRVKPTNGSMEEQQILEDSLLNYTFLTENSIIIFEEDSIKLTAHTPGYSLPLTLYYHYKKDVLTIHPPFNLPILIQGYVYTDQDVMEYQLTPESYLTLLDYVNPPFRQRILSADMTYELQKIE